MARAHEVEIKIADLKWFREIGVRVSDLLLALDREEDLSDETIKAVAQLKRALDVGSR